MIFEGTDEMAWPRGDRSNKRRKSSGDPFLVVALGASAGGHDALRRLLSALPPNGGMAFIMIQHLDPTHESMMVELLSRHTEMPMHQAENAMVIAPDHVYVISPGTYLAVANGALLVSPPIARHGARLPFDFLLHSLALAYGSRAVAVVLSGTGADGSSGVYEIKARSGLVIAQSPDEAQFDGMPRSAIATGAVDAILPLADIPAALMRYRQTSGTDRPGTPPAASEADGEPGAPDALPDAFWAIIALLRDSTGHDFTLYKPGTLQRRIERRMALVAIRPTGIAQYLAKLRDDTAELGLLAKDLLINVTRFFRDSAVFAVLEERVIPDLMTGRAEDHPLRVWIAGCSSGEETYSLAILCHERMAALDAAFKLQIFASDIDAEAVAAAREGVYPKTIEADVTPARLERYFTRDEDNYRISTELRSLVVFTVQDVLSDPPFSRLDLVTCRNLLIYLRPEAQTRIINLFHFALRDGGILLLGSAETIGAADHRFEPVAKAERVYRRIGRSRSGDFGVTALLRDTPRGGLAVRTLGTTPAHPGSLAELVRRLVLEAFAPAAVLINQRHDCLYLLGPVDRYLQVAPGLVSHDVLAMTRPGVRTKLRSAIRRANQDRTRVVVAGGVSHHDGAAVPFSIDVQPVASEGGALLLICFVESRTVAEGTLPAAGKRDAPQIATLERELAATRTELLGAIHDLELSGEDQKAINEEALSVNEEFQSTNEELLTSKEELQSLNEELTALNNQLQETLERQRTTANDLQNVLFSTDMATLFLDTELKIRFFTPATRALFNVIPSDIGRPLADLTALGGDGELTNDARDVLETLAPVEREVAGRGATWFTRRVLPYRTQQNGVEGVVITFIDITERKTIARALEDAKQAAERANNTKSRFLAAASHDLRQPLQTLSLLQGLLTRAATGTPMVPLVGRLEQTVGAMSSLLNTLLDINQIEAGVVQVTPSQFAVDAIFDALRAEFIDAAAARGLALRVIPCGVIIETDRPLLQQILRNLVSNAIKYTNEGRVLVGCRRIAGLVRIEVWDTGIGIPEGELQAIFEEYHQLDNPARERSRGLGLGLSIVRRLADLLELPLELRSRPARGSVFTIEVPRARPGTLPPPAPAETPGTDGAPPLAYLILVVEDDPDVRDLLVMFLKEEGHRVVAAADGDAAIALVAAGAWPDLIVADYNLPNRMNGVAVVQRVRGLIGIVTPVIILTGDISSATLTEIAGQDCIQFNKPMSFSALTAAIEQLLPAGRQRRLASGVAVLIIDDDPGLM